MPIKKDNNRGFSLIELVIIILIAVVLAFTLYPRIKKATGFRLPVASKKVLQDIRYARQKSMDTRVPYGVNFQVPDQYWVYRSVAATYAEDPLTRQDYIVNLDTGEYEGVTLNSADFSGDIFVEFDSSGTPSNGGSVILTDGTGTRTITVEAATGMITH